MSARVGLIVHHEYSDACQLRLSGLDRAVICCEYAWSALGSTTLDLLSRLLDAPPGRPRAFQRQDAVLLTVQTVVVHEELFQLTHEVAPQLVHVLDVGVAVITLLYRHHPIVALAILTISLFPLNDADHAAGQLASRKGGLIISPAAAASDEGTLTAQESTPRPIPVSPNLESDSVLEDEVRILRRELQSTVEAFEATNEELKAANEEVTSVNEELQSANEELQTGKEELQRP